MSENMYQHKQPDYLALWCVTFNTKDYPDTYVARLWHNGEVQETCVVSKDLETITRKMMERGLVRLDRHPDDDPVIVETWL